MLFLPLPAFAGTLPPDFPAHEQLAAHWRYGELAALDAALTDWDIELLIESRLSTELIEQWIGWLDCNGATYSLGYHVKACADAGLYSPACLDDPALRSCIPPCIRELQLRRELYWNSPELDECEDYWQLSQVDVSVQQVRAWCAYLNGLGLCGSYGRRIRRYFEMGIKSPDDLLALQSDKRPAALVALAAEDWNGAIYGPHAFRLGEGVISGARNTVLSLAHYYSVYPVVLIDEEELNALSLPGTRDTRKLLIVYGHGDSSAGGGESGDWIEGMPLRSIRFGWSWPRMQSGVLGVGDSQVAWLIDKFADDAPVVLLGCDTQAAVDFVKENAGMRTVWGTTDVFYADNISFAGLRMEWNHPVFGMEITLGGKDITYKR